MSISRIVVDAAVLHGKPRVRGTRIGVSMVLELLAEGISPRAICSDWYPDLTEADVRACIDFANRSLSGETIYITHNDVTRRRRRTRTRP